MKLLQRSKFAESPCDGFEARWSIHPQTQHLLTQPLGFVNYVVLFQLCLSVVCQCFLVHLLFKYFLHTCGQYIYIYIEILVSWLCASSSKSATSPNTQTNKNLKQKKQTRQHLSFNDLFRLLNSQASAQVIASNLKMSQTERLLEFPMFGAVSPPFHSCLTVLQMGLSGTIPFDEDS